MFTLKRPKIKGKEAGDAHFKMKKHAFLLK